MINYLSGTYNYKKLELPEGGVNMPEELTKNIKERVQKMLLGDGWTLVDLTTKETIWAWIAEDPMHRKLVIGQRVGREDELIIQASVNITSDTTTRMNGLSEKERNEFLWDLRFELLRTNLEFEGISLPLKQIIVSERICLDALSKDAVLQRASEVRKGLLIVLWMIARKFGQPPPPRQLGFIK